jgi:putative addiction module component (TIGR02574 family)
MDVDINKLLTLPITQRMTLARMLWDSIPDHADLEALPLSHRERTELDQRLDEYEADGAPAHGRPVEDVLADLYRKL